MNKYQEAWKRIKYTTNYDVRVFDDNDEEIKLIQELVDKATPKKPNEYESQSGESYECKCGYPLPIVKHKDCFMDSEGCVNNFCRFCGQALDWSKDE